MAELRARLHRVASGILRDDADAADAVQDAYCNLLTSREPTSSDETRFRLFVILRNVCFNKLKQRRSTVPLDALASEATFAEPDETARLRTLLLGVLTEGQRRVFELAVFDELEYDEIASRLGMSTEAVRMNMSRARRRVREEYKRLQL